MSEGEELGDFIGDWRGRSRIRYARVTEGVFCYHERRCIFSQKKNVASNLPISPTNCHSVFDCSEVAGSSGFCRFLAVFLVSLSSAVLYCSLFLRFLNSSWPRPPGSTACMPFPETRSRIRPSCATGVRTPRTPATVSALALFNEEPLVLRLQLHRLSYWKFLLFLVVCGTKASTFWHSIFSIDPSSSLS